MFALQVRYHAREEQYLFDSTETVFAELAAIQSRIGKKWYGKNGDEETPTYTIKHRLGEAVVCLEKIESAAVVDFQRDESVAEELFDRKLAMYIRHKAKETRAKVEAGLADAPAGESPTGSTAECA